jgi:nucleotide-binding universal stress UspA family protein
MCAPGADVVCSGPYAIGSYCRMEAHGVYPHSGPLRPLGGCGAGDRAGPVTGGAVPRQDHTAHGDVPGPISHVGEGTFFDQYLERHGRQYLNELCATRMRAAAVPVDLVVRLGTAAEGILACAVESYADLIVISAHGTAGLGSSLGSTASTILQEAPCPVLLLRTKSPTGEPGEQAG